MHFRRFACFLLGAWIVGSALIDVVATENFHAVDVMLAEPSFEAAAQIKKLGRDDARMFLRYQAAEQNRSYFEQWERIQFGIALALFLVLLNASEPGKFALMACIAMASIVFLDRFVLTPEMIKLGRLIDFLPTATPSPDRSRFWTFHGAYSSLEVAKIAMGLILTATLVFRGRHDRKRFSRKVDGVDVADHSRVDR